MGEIARARARVCMCDRVWKQTPDAKLKCLAHIVSAAVIWHAKLSLASWMLTVVHSATVG